MRDPLSERLGANGEGKISGCGLDTPSCGLDAPPRRRPEWRRKGAIWCSNEQINRFMSVLLKKGLPSSAKSDIMRPLLREA